MIQTALPGKWLISSQRSESRIEVMSIIHNLSPFDFCVLTNVAGFAPREYGSRGTFEHEVKRSAKAMIRRRFRRPILD